MCDIWEKWVVWVEKEDTFARGEGKKKEEAKRYHSLGRREIIRIKKCRWMHREEWEA